MSPTLVAQLILMAGQLLGQGITLAEQMRATASIEDQQKLDAAIAASRAAAGVAIAQAEADLSRASGA